MGLSAASALYIEACCETRSKYAESFEEAEPAKFFARKQRYEPTYIGTAQIFSCCRLDLMPSELCDQH
jgi:hypothetical protein